MTEQDARIVINRKLTESGWILEGSNKNVLTEQYTGKGVSDYLLLGRKGHEEVEYAKPKDIIAEVSGLEQKIAEGLTNLQKKL